MLACRLSASIANAHAFFGPVQFEHPISTQYLLILHLNFSSSQNELLFPKNGVRNFIMVEEMKYLVYFGVEASTRAPLHLHTRTKVAGPSSEPLHTRQSLLPLLPQMQP